MLYVIWIKLKIMIQKIIIIKLRNFGVRDSSNHRNKKPSSKGKQIEFLQSLKFLLKRGIKQIYGMRIFKYHGDPFWTVESQILMPLRSHGKEVGGK